MEDGSVWKNAHMFIILRGVEVTVILFINSKAGNVCRSLFEYQAR
jgi:hypothetical protein